MAVATSPPYRHVHEVWSEYLIVKGRDQFFKVPFTHSDGKFTFGAEKKVRVQYVDLAEGETVEIFIDLAPSAAYPDLERKPGGPDNWVEAAGGLPSYIERIAKHLHYENGFTISRAIATAVNTVKRWARGGTVTKNGTTKRITPATQAKAAKAVAEWEAKKASARAKRAGKISLSNGREVDLDALAERCRQIQDPEGKARARAQILDLAMTKDGRKSYKRQGKWGHGFVPLDEAARESKAKGSPIARKRINRLYGKGKGADKAVKQTATVQVKTKTGGTTRVRDVGQARDATIKDAGSNQRVKLGGKEDSRGGGRSQRATKPWNEIPESQKTIRNGKRYVMAIFGGKLQLTEWVGPVNNEVETSDLGRRRLNGASESTLKNMSNGQLRQLLRVKGQSGSAKKSIYALLKKRGNQKKAA